ncbi:uncharacterized protein LOC127807251 [Diospyros lotus]|uniref:uncharacterized protein LOC127807251 n=1 Tax=Diospyros lotus TaxID=55363 RepID=UPI0022526CFE|nr:uncharacterized protein LOC127807251 [Diospyros lotus]
MASVMASQGGGTTVLRDYRKGNWTVQETMVLIEAKKMDDERRMKRTGESEGRSKPAELRWKWVEDYCWRNGCLRSQNQCNDKWDNLMRDFKKVRDYERQVAEKGGVESESSSYWKIEKQERKERNLPSNMLPQIYYALLEVVERREGIRLVGSAAGGSGSSVQAAATPGYVLERSTSISAVQPSLPPPLQLPVSSSAPVAASPLPPPPAPPPAGAPPHDLPHSQPFQTLDSDTSDYSDSPAKRRRRRGGGEGTSGCSNEVGSAISKSASMIAEAIQACEEREERRHRELLSLQERRLQMEESRMEMTRQGISGLADAINKLASSILAFASSHRNQSTPN